MTPCLLIHNTILYCLLVALTVLPARNSITLGERLTDTKYVEFLDSAHQVNTIMSPRGVA